MKHLYNYLISAICLLSVSCTSIMGSSDRAEVINASQIQPYGRYIINKDQHLELISSAAHFGFSFEGKECQLFAFTATPNAHNYIQYELDGVYQKRIRIAGNATEPIVITAPTAGKHKVWIYKATEAHTGPIVIAKVSGENVKAIHKPAAPLIEFIGNSITCGAAADPSEVPCGTGVYHDQHNAYMAYGPRLARKLGADFVLSSVSGIGIYRNWNSNGPTMPQVYEKVDFQDQNSQNWDFNKFTPQVISIALGTNDFSNGDGVKERLPFDSASFVNNYIAFVQQVRAKQPLARIVLLSSPMLNGFNRTLLQNCLSTVKENVDAMHSEDEDIQLYFFQPMQPRGCTGHPNVEDHAILAEELAPFFRKLLQPQAK